MSALIATKDTLALVSWSPEYQSWKLNAFLSHGGGWIEPSRSSTEVPLLRSSRSRPNLSSHAWLLLLSLPGDESVTLVWLPYFFDTVSVTAVFPKLLSFLQISSSSVTRITASRPYWASLYSAASHWWPYYIVCQLLVFAVYLWRVLSCFLAGERPGCCL